MSWRAEAEVYCVMPELQTTAHSQRARESGEGDARSPLSTVCGRLFSPVRAAVDDGAKHGGESFRWKRPEAFASHSPMLFHSGSA